MPDATEAKIKAELARGVGLSIITLIDALIGHAHAVRASDIHIDPTATTLRVRLRVDGVMADAFIFPKDIAPEVISRIKVLTGLRTDEHQASQDGRFRMVMEDGGAVDVRVSIAPTYYGENAVLRLLSDKADEYTLESLGFSTSDQAKITKALKKPYGMILSTGPTGSGKTTTLYTMLKMLNGNDVSIVTIEDPIEYAVDGIKQIQVNPRTGLTFASGLRSILRQDPNIIMVGEIRDAETASIAVNIALTGHLLLSTLHTNDAATTLPRLLDMKIDSYLVASTVNVAIGQRLVRRICVSCKEPKTLTPLEEKSLDDALSTYSDTKLRTNNFFYGKGCGECAGSGFRGRITINEVLIVDPDIREALLRRASVPEIKAKAIAGGMTTMLDDGIEKAIAGLTTLEEVLKAVSE